MEEKTFDAESLFAFVSDILKARPEENSHIAEFESLVSKDFTEFCEEVSGLNQMKDVSKFDQILDEMRLIKNCPPLHSKMVGAIGGGFSSGKSTFINSFMLDNSISLATGIVPVTAIPSYVICGESPSIKGISYRGGSFDIESSVYKALAHENLKKIDFDLKEILSYITLKARLDAEYFGNICLIDTPGYNAAAIGSSAQDEETAFSYIKDAKFLIWIVNSGKGTINTDDLSFLSKLPFGQEEGRSLYVVVNRASLIAPSHHEDILSTFKDTLDDYGFLYDGISLYDSKEKKEYLFDKLSVKDFLKSQNIPTKKYVELALPLLEIFDRYENYAKKKHTEDSEFQRKIQKLILDGLQSNAISVSSSAASKLEDGLYELKKYLKPGDLSSTLKKIDALKGKFVKCLNFFCSDVGIEIQKVELPKQDTTDGGEQSTATPKRKKFCDKCGTKLSPDNKFCPKCGTPTAM